MEKNIEYVGEVLSLGSEGEGVINYEGVTAFVPLCLPGEKVGFKALKVSGGVAYGKLVKTHTSSSDRVAPICPVFGKCGGCQLQHMNYNLQLSFKRQMVQNCLKKIGGLSVDVQPCVPSDDEYGYRNKLAVPVGVDAEGNTVVGFYAPRSHRIVPVEQCALQQEWSGKLIKCLCDFMQACGLKGYNELTKKGDVRQLVARELDGKFIITVVAARRINLSPFAKMLESTFDKFTLLLNINSTTSNVIFGKEWQVCRGEGFFDGEDMGVKFKAGANTFVQINDGVRGKLYKKVRDEVCAENVVAVDLYSGGGMLTALLAKGCKAAYGIEIVKEAVECANELKEANGLSNKMVNVCGAVEDKLGEVFALTEGAERVIVCDPPRKGMERSVVKAILASGAKKVVLVSCGPATLARDLGLLCGSLKEVDGQIVKNPDYASAPQSGYYEIEYVIPFDMFPQTKHVETVVQLVRKKPDAYIDITVDMDELDLTASEAKATYKKIKEYIFEKHNVKVSSLYIAQVKQKYGIIERENYNKPSDENARQPKCPAEKEILIEEALRHFKMIS